MLAKKKSSFVERQNNSCTIRGKNINKYNILLIVNDLSLSDKSEIVADFANYLVLQKVGVVILSNLVVARLFFDEKIKIITNKHFNNQFYKSLFARYLIKKICRKFHIDALVACEYNTYQDVIACGKKMNMPTIAWFFSTTPLLSRFDYFKIACIKKFDLMISNSDTISRFLLNNFNIDTRKLRQLDVPVDDEIFDKNNITKGRIKEAINDVGVDIGNKKIIFYQCNFNDLPMCIEILKVIKLIKRDDFVCVMSGVVSDNYDNYKKLIQVAKQLNVNNRVRVIDAVCDKSAILASSYIVICMCKQNGVLSKTLYEAASVGKPSIVLTRDDFSNVTIDYKTGFCVKDGNIYEIRNAIVRILDCSDDEYQNMCNNAYNYARKHFLKNVVLESIHNDIVEIIKKNIDTRMKPKTSNVDKNIFLFKENK